MANFILHPQKCQFMLKELKYLGHFFNEHVVTADPRKTAIVQNYPRRTTVKS